MRARGEAGHFQGERRKLYVWLLMAVLLGVRLYGITHSPFEAGDFWRQPDTESIALNFLRDGFTVFKPSLNYDGPPPNVYAVELQVLTVPIALLYKLFGHHYALGRLVPIAFFLGSCLYLYHFGRRYIGDVGALWATALYGLFPVNIFYSRTFQPEAVGMFFSLGALYYAQRYAEADERENVSLALATGFLAMALMQKPQTIVTALPMLGLLWQRHGAALFKQGKLWLAAGVALAMPLLYYGYTHAIAEYQMVGAITSKHILQRFYSDIFTPAALEFFRLKLPEAFTRLGLALFVIALFVRRQPSVFYLLLLGGLINAVAVIAVIKFPYYLVYITPIPALFSGGLLGQLRRQWALIAAAAVLFIGVTGFSTVRPMYAELDYLKLQGQVVQSLTEPDDLIVGASYDPAVFVAAERFGWRYQLHHWPHIPTDPYEELQYYIDHGAKYFVPIAGQIYNDPTGEIKQHIEQTYRRLEPVPGYPIYVLRED